MLLARNGPLEAVDKNPSSDADWTAERAYTIGYEGKTLEAFVEMLTAADVDCVVDVRENAFSFKKGFSKKALESSLAASGVKYVHIPELGTDRESRSEYRRTADFQKLASSFRARFSEDDGPYLRLRMEIGRQTTALMCFEDDHSACHRSIIAERLVADGVEVVHIRSGRRSEY